MYFSTHHTARNMSKSSHRQRIDDTDCIYHIYIIFHLLLHHLENKLLHGSRDSNQVCKRYLLTITVRYIFAGAPTLLAPSNTQCHLSSLYSTLPCHNLSNLSVPVWITFPFEVLFAGPFL